MLKEWGEIYKDDAEACTHDIFPPATELPDAHLSEKEIPVNQKYLSIGNRVIALQEQGNDTDTILRVLKKEGLI